MGIKEEIQGQTGYLKKVRDKYMPDTKTMAELAFALFMEQCEDELTPEYVAENADSILKALFLAETSIFQEKNNEIMYRVLPYFYSDIYSNGDKKYVESTQKMEELVQVFNNCKKESFTVDRFIRDISEITVPIIDVVSFSQKQSAKCRVGETLQNHLANIFQMCKVSYETQQQKNEGGTIMDFVIPNVVAIEEMPDQVINIECQTTLKDRFRLTTGKSTDAKIKRYLATITGAGIVTTRDLHDFSVDKVKEIIMDNNVTLVVFKEVKERIIKHLLEAEQKIKEGKNISNATVTKDEMERLVKLSDKKIISYADLIKRDIKSVLVYWETEKD